MRFLLYLILTFLLWSMPSQAFDTRKIPKLLTAGGYCTVGQKKIDAKYEYTCDFAEERNGKKIGYWSKTEILTPTKEISK